jgi:hypothetical protein
MAYATSGSLFSSGMNGITMAPTSDDFRSVVFSRKSKPSAKYRFLCLRVGFAQYETDEKNIDEACAKALGPLIQWARDQLQEEFWLLADMVRNHATYDQTIYVSLNTNCDKDAVLYKLTWGNEPEIITVF